MPSKSQKQNTAMRAAAAGRSNLGIPAKIGREYVAADRAKSKLKKPGKRNRKAAARRTRKR